MPKQRQTTTKQTTTPESEYKKSIQQTGRQQVLHKIQQQCNQSNITECTTKNSPAHPYTRLSIFKG